MYNYNEFKWEKKKHSHNLEEQNFTDRATMYRT